MHIFVENIGKLSSILLIQDHIVYTPCPQSFAVVDVKYIDQPGSGSGLVLMNIVCRESEPNVKITDLACVHA